MFFIFSKVLLFIISPLNWVFALLLYSLFSKKPKRKRNCLIAGILLAYFISNHFIFNQVIKVWEVDTITMDQIQDTFDIGILLGGYTNLYIEPNHDRHNFSESANRFNNTLELYYKGKIKKILLTGGNGDLVYEVAKEADLANRYLQTLGIPPEDIIVENASRNTYENAIFTKKILDKDFPNQSCLLITSAWHMRRSAAIFKKQQIEVTPFSVHFLGEKTKFGPRDMFLPDKSGFWHWELLIKEWVGYVAYKAKGYL